MRWASTLLLALLVVPSVNACSLAYTPFQDAQWTPDGFWFIDGDRLVQVEGANEFDVVTGYFLSFAVLPDGLLIAGQTGLSAGCGGQDWLELRRGGNIVWREEAEARVMAHALGPRVVLGGQFWQLVGDDLVALDESVRANAQTLGWTGDGKPIQQQDDALYVGDWKFPFDGYARSTAVHGKQVAVAEQRQTQVMLYVLEEGTASRITWTTQAAAWSQGGAWSHGWFVLAGGRAYHVSDKVVDVGLADVQSVAQMGDRAAVFQSDGYVVFDGTRPVGAWARRDGVWAPVAIPRLTATEVAATFGAATPLQTAPPSPPTDVNAPGLPLGALALCFVILGLALRGRRFV